MATAAEYVTTDEHGVMREASSWPERRRAKSSPRWRPGSVRVMRKHGVVVNDLHATSTEFPAEFFVGPGNVHFTNQGSEALAEQVIAAIETALP